MVTRRVDAEALRVDEDWVGNNVSFTCPSCSKVYIVSGMMHKSGRPCTGCGKSKGHVSGGKGSGGTASITYEE